MKLGLFAGGFTLQNAGEAGKKRIDAPGRLRHIVLRGMDRRKIFRVSRYGIERRKIFRDDQDR